MNTSSIRELQLSATLAALADPTRRAMVGRLARGPATAGELAAPFDITAPSVSRHLKVLEAAGLVSRRREAQWQVFTLQPKPIRLIANWFDQYQEFWESSFDALERHILERKKTEVPRDGARRSRGIVRRG